jgi:hypothetical protein
VSSLRGLLGIGKLGVLDRIGRLSALLACDRPHGKITRADKPRAAWCRDTLRYTQRKTPVSTCSPC